MSKPSLDIVIIPSWYFSKGSNAIAGYLFFEHTKALREAGINASIAYTKFSVHARPFTGSSFDLERGVPTWRAESWFPPKRNHFLIRRWIKKSGEATLKHFKSEGRPSLIHAQGFQAGWIAEYIFHQANIPYILSEHNSSFLQDNIPDLFKTYIQSAFKHASFSTAVSPGLKEAITAYTAIDDIHVIPNHYNPDIFYPSEKEHKKGKPFQWITAGEPIHTKGLDILLSAFSQVAHQRPGEEHRLILADDIPQVHKLKRQARQTGILPFIRFAGLLLPGQLADLMRDSHALISSSRFETFGRTLVEANACGIPIVATRTPGASYILQQEAQGQLCEIESADSLAEAMIYIHDHYEQYTSAGTLQAVQSRFHRDIVLKQWMEIYNSI